MQLLRPDKKQRYPKSSLLHPLCFYTNSFSFISLINFKSSSPNKVFVHANQGWVNFEDHLYGKFFLKTGVSTRIAQCFNRPTDFLIIRDSHDAQSNTVLANIRTFNSVSCFSFEEICIVFVSNQPTFFW